MATVTANGGLPGKSWFGLWRPRWKTYLQHREEQVFMLLSLLIGALTGLAVVAFILVTERLGMRLYPVHGAAWRRFVMPVAGSLAMGYLLFRYFPNARGSGVPQTKAALYAHDGYISLRTVLGKFVCTATTLACGIPLGREGPSVQVGAGIASICGRWLGLRPEKVKALIPVGAAAAIAAAFNTPMAAVLFALEEVVGDLHAPVLGSVVLASATSWATLRLLLGNDPLFKVPQYTLVNPLEFGIYALLGVAGGLLSVAFTQLLLRMRKYFLSLPRKTQWWHPVVGGLVVGVMGWFVPQMMGVGYTYVGNALNGTMVLRLMLLLVVLKLLGVTVSYATGNAGGIFGPALFLGAMLGGIVGTISHHFLPGYTAQPGAYALVGMGALFAGIVRAPMTSVLMIFEMTRDYAVIVPLMIANMTSLVIASHFQEEPVYEALAHQDGIRLPNQSDRDESNFRTVMQVMRTAPLVLPGELTLREAAETIQKSNAGLVDGHPEDTSRYRNWPVADKDFFVGMIGKETIDQAVSDGRGDRPLITAVQTMNVPYAHADQPLFLVLDTMSKTHLDVLPVVRRADLHTLVGIVTLRDVLDSYGVDCLGTEPAATNGTISPAVL